MTPSSVVDICAPDANMYGCQPCPKCGSKFRFQLERKPDEIQCDDCGHVEERTK